MRRKEGAGKEVRVEVGSSRGFVRITDCASGQCTA